MCAGAGGSRRLREDGFLSLSRARARTSRGTTQFRELSVGARYKLHFLMTPRASNRVTFHSAFDKFSSWPRQSARGRRFMCIARGSRGKTRTGVADVAVCMRERGRAMRNIYRASDSRSREECLLSAFFFRGHFV